MKPEITYSDLEEQFRDACSRIADFRAVPDETFNRKPDPKRWSVAEIFGHLIQFNRLYESQLNRAITSSRPVPHANKTVFSPRLPYRFFLQFLEPPYKIKVPTLSPMEPAKSDPKQKQELINDLLYCNESLLSLVEALREKNADPDAIRGKNPVARWVSMSATEFLLILAAHQRRHFWQAEQTLKLFNHP
jgi:hypothetical protein